MKGKLIIFGIAFFLMVMLVLPAAACPPGLQYTCGPHDDGTCPEGQHCEMTASGYYGEWHEPPHPHTCNLGNEDTCQCTKWGQVCDSCWHPKDHGYGDHYGSDCTNCGSHQECNEYEHRSYVDPVYACIDDACGVDYQCDEGFHCGDKGCESDLCGEDFQCDTGYQCNDEKQCVPVPEEIRSSSFSPFTEPICSNILTERYPMDDIDPKTLPLLPLKNTYIHADFRYDSQFDCVYMAYYTRGQPSFNRDCTAVEFFNRGQEAIKSYGGMPSLTAFDPAGALCVGAVKNYQTEKTLPVTITLTDSHGGVGDVIVSSDPIIQKCYQLPEDFSECRLRDSFSLFTPWIK